MVQNFVKWFDKDNIHNQNRLKWIQPAQTNAAMPMCLAEPFGLESQELVL